MKSDSKPEWIYGGGIPAIVPKPVPTVEDARRAYEELLAAVMAEDKCHPNLEQVKQTSGGGRLVLYGAECTCGDKAHYWGTSVWAEYPAEDCWVKD